jgi:IPT/TIG domain-containing protein/FG-GAP repeat protein
MSRARSGLALAAFAALVACLLFAAVGGTNLDGSTTAEHPGGSLATTGAIQLPSAGTPAARRSSMLSAPAQGPISAAIGKSQEAYWIRGSAGANPSQHLRLRFTNDGVVVASASSSFRLGLGSLGRAGGPAVPLPAARPNTARNRVTYERGAVDEWYANGPIGLEQGFDIRSRPLGSGLLTLSIPTSSGVRLESARDGAVVLQGPHGRSLLYAGLSADDAHGHSLKAWLGHRGNSLLINVDDRSARYPVRIDPFLQQTELLSPDSAEPQFGQSVAVASDGNTVLIGAPYTGYTATTGQAPGAAYVYVRSGGTWSEQAELVGTSAIGDAFQGSSVALSADGDTALIGGPSDDSYAGAAWVFTRSGTTWTQISKLVALGVTGAPDAAGEQGWSVALSGDGSTALLGAPHDGGNDVGAAWVFVDQNGAWTEQGSKLTATTNPAQQGYSVALSTNGSTALVGSPDDNTNEGGGAWVYTRSGTTWSQQGSELVGTTDLEESAEGQSVALSGDGNTALIGGNNDTSSGGVWIFTRSGSTWSQQGSELLGTGNSGNAGQGFSVALSTDGNTALVGGPYDSSSTGAAWLYTRSGSTWSQLGSKLAGTGGKAGSDGDGIQQGYAVGLSGDGNTAVLGGPANNNGTGGAWVFVNGPSVTAVSPASGPSAGGNQVTITGTNFVTGAAVAFGSTAATDVTVINSTTITATAPAYTGLTHQDGSAMVDVTVTTPAGTSATSTADQYTYDAVPTVTAVSPAAGPTAAGTAVTITGTHFVTGATVAFGSSPATNVTVVSSGSITATAPAGSAGTVDVTVTTPGGTSAASAADHYTYDAPPTVTAVSPSSGPLGGGNTVTITGTNLTGATAVDFGNTAATNVTVTNSTQITATAPSGSAGTVDVTVTTPGGTTATSAADHYTYAAGPSVASVSPDVGSTSGGTSVTITGTGFTNATAVEFGATNATNFMVDNPTSITATVPAESAGTVDVTVTTPSGTSTTSAADHYTYDAAPTVTGVSPVAGPTVGGNTVTLTGTNFNNATAVKFGTVSAGSYTVNSATSITIGAPAGSAGTVDITVTTPGGTSGTSAADQYTYVPAPTVTAISPTAGPLGGTTTVTITGTNLTGTTAVDFGNTAATGFTVNGATSITATAPAESAGTVDITVTTPGGTSATSAADHYTYVAAPTVTAVNPTQGPLGAGTSVSISGTGFTNTSTVTFGATNATSFTINSATSITATAPAGSAGTVDVTVTTPGGISATSSADRYTYVAAPTVTAVDPTQGPLGAGTTVSITGTGFTNASAVKFGTVSASYTVNSPTGITATAPAGSAGPVHITVTTPGGISATSTADQYTYDAQPTVTAVNPVSGRLAGGDTVTITGTNLTSATAVSFGGTAATSFTVNGATSITATSPAESAGTVNVTVTTPGGTSATGAADQYTYVPAPTVTAVTPTAGPLGAGTPVTVKGTNLSGATAVTFGTTNAAITADTATQITVTAPAGTAGTVNVTVTTPGGTSATGAADQYTYTAAPTITGVSPSGGPLGGGTSVKITGTNLSGATAVKFGTTNAATITSDTATSITATSPAESAGQVDITVTTAGGTSATSSSDKYTYTTGPVITSITPTSGPLAGGTLVTITGTNLAGATAVKFGSSKATSIPLNTATSITAIAPPESAGLVDITVTTVGGNSPTGSADQYTYLPPPIPAVGAVSPSSGPTTGGTVVTISGANFTGATVVGFGNTAATGVTVNSDSQITATAPAEPSGTVDVTVTTPNGTSQTTPADEYTYTTPTVTTSGGATTVATPPSVSPSPTTLQGSTSAGLQGQVNPNGLATSAYFEYGIDPSDRGPGSSTVLYDQTTPVQPVGSDSTDHPISIPIAGLVPNALYHVRLVASNSAGTTVGPDQTFTTPASAPPPPPVLGQAVNAAPVSGVVFIKPPPGKTLGGAGDTAALSKGTGFVPLTEARQIPTGSEVDALNGSLKLVSNTGQIGKTQTATLTGGIFKVTQARNGISKGIADFNLVESAFQGAPSYSVCNAKHKAGDATIASLSTKTLQLLKVSGHGKFKTTGRYASATVRGTIYTVADRCDGTLTHVIRDTVLVDDFVRHKTILLHAGQSYLAKKP